MTEPHTVKIATINVWSGLTYQGIRKMGEYERDHHRARRYRALVDHLRKVSPDIICIQEANPLPSYTRNLAWDLGYKAYGFIGMGGIHLGLFGLPVNFREGDAILVHPRFQVAGLGKQQLSGDGVANNWFTFHFDELTQIVGIRISVNGWSASIFNTHLHAGPGPSSTVIADLRELLLNGEITRPEMKEILQEYEQNEQRRIAELETGIRFVQQTAHPDEPIILAGDLNLEPGSDAYQILVNEGFQDTYVLNPSDQYFTWNAESNTNIQDFYPKPDAFNNVMEKARWLYDRQSKRIDYIWIQADRQSFAVRTTSLFGTSRIFDVHPSDHFGYLAEIEFTPEENSEDQ